MIRWNNDYNRSAHPAVLSLLKETEDLSYPGYGLDSWNDRAASIIKGLIQSDCADVHFLLGGTQANYTIAAAALRPYQGILCADTAHIHVHETGAVENTGHKILAIPGVNGKITAEDIAREAEAYRVSGVQEHITQPKLVYLSFPTEYGTLYSLNELNAIRNVCDEYNMYLYIDGARMGYGLGSPENDVTLPELAMLADAFYIGGTKCGAMFGEAVVLLNNDLKDHFRSYIKQNGGMLAKGWLLGLQFCALLQDNLYFTITRFADDEAMRIRNAFREKGIPFFIESPTNQQFVILTASQLEQLGKKHISEYEQSLPDGRHVVRFCTSWSTQPEDTDELITDIFSL